MHTQLILRSTVEQPITIEDYLKFPDDKRHEFIEGNIYVSEYTPSYEVPELQYYLHKANNNSNALLLSSLRLYLAEMDSIVEPQLMLVPKASIRLPSGSSEQEWDEWAWEANRFGNFQVVPYLVVEITSQENYRTDHVVKFQLYEKAGIQEYWIVNPRTFSVTVWVLVEGQYQLHGEFVEEEMITSTILEGLIIRTRDLFRYYSRRESQIAEQ
jgi:Uma2 family endonuclease